MSVSLVGVGAVGESGGSNPTYNAGRAADDIHILFAETQSGTVTTPSSPSAWEVGPVVANGAGTTKIATFLLRDPGGSPATPALAGGADHVVGFIMTIRGAPLGAVLATLIDYAKAYATAATTTAFAPSVYVPEGDCLVIHAVAWAIDDATDIASAWANANLTGFAERLSVGTATAGGGGISVASGQLAAAGETGLGTCTVTSTTFACMTLVFKSAAPAPSYALAGQAIINGAPAANGVTVKLWDLTLGVLENTGVTSGGTGSYSIPAKFNDAGRYLATYEDGTNRGCSPASTAS